MIDSHEFRKIVDHGYRYGHNLNPQYPEIHELPFDDMLELGPKHALAQQFIASVQNSDANLETIARAVHGREVNIDGDAGPATLRLLDVPRCQCPDFGQATIEDTGTGSWLPSCYPDFENIHAVVMALDKRNMQSAWLDNLDYLIEAMTAAQHAVGFHPIWKFDLSGEANMKITWRGIARGTIGFNTVPYSFRCGMTITGSIDTGYSPSGEDGKKRLGRLGMHEWFGHGCGYGHTRGGIMNPSILGGEISWVGDQLYDKMVKNFGGPIVLGPGGWRHEEWL